MEALTKSLTLLRSSLSNCKILTIFAQVGDHVSNQGNIGSQNNNATDDIIHEYDRNANVGNGRNECSYKDFVACKPKEFDGKGGAVAYIRWVKKMEAVQDISGCGDNQKVKYFAGSLTVLMVMVVATEPPTIQNAILKARVLTDEAVRNGSLRKSGEKRGNGGESSKEGNVKGDNKRARTGKVFAIITNPVKKKYTGLAPKLIMEYLVKISKKACILELKRRHLKINDSDILYAVIKGEFEKPESQKISDDSFTCNTSLDFFHKEFNRMSRMDDDLFTYEVEIFGLANIPCDLNEEDDSGQRMTHGSDDDMEYDPSNVEFTKCLASKFYNHMTMDQYTKKHKIDYLD
ncbi:hypothetical protein Tco_1283881 [Tanacetum coccineum]